MSDSNSVDSLVRSSLNVYGAAIFNCSRHFFLRPIDDLITTEAAPNLWTLGLDRFWVMVVDSLRSVFRHARVRSAVPQVHWLGQAGRGQAEHCLQRVPVGQVFEFSGTQVAEG